MPPPLTRAGVILAWAVVVLTVLAVWEFTEYRNRPPAVPQATSDH